MSKTTPDGGRRRDGAQPIVPLPVAATERIPSRESVWAPVSNADRAAALRLACRLFRGFESLPDAVVESLYGFPFLFVARRGDLLLREREIIARTITGEPPGPFGDDPLAIEDEAQRGSRSLERDPVLSRREIELAQFAGKITQSSAEVRGEDFERMFVVGYTPAAVREVADVALVFRVIHRLTAAVNAHAASVSPGASSAMSGSAAAARVAWLSALDTPLASADGDASGDAPTHSALLPSE